MCTLCNRLMAVSVLLAVVLLGQQEAITAPTAQQPNTAAWTLDEAIAHLKLSPRDVYMQYVALQLARQEGRLPEVVTLIQRSNPRRDPWRKRQEQVHLFSIFSGQLAVQESLQLDALVPEEAMQNPEAEFRQVGPQPLRQGNNANQPPVGQVAIADLTGPTIKSHPWSEMLAGKKPQVTGLALKVPADCYFISFASLSKLLDATELANLYGAHALNQASHDAKTQLVGERLRQQLAVKDDPLLRPFYDAVVTEVALVGSDLFLREGSDVTLLFSALQPALLRAKMDGFLDEAARLQPDATRSRGKYLGIEYQSVTTPDRQIQVYSAYPTPDLHVRSNSLAGLQRVLAAVIGKDEQGQKVTRLGETDEFRYVRTLLPQGATEEDGFIYLSDPFVRRLMSPELRLTQRRRQGCYNHLRMIGHAALMHRTQTGKMATTLGELAKAGCSLEEFGRGKYICPDGGEYTLGPDGLTGVCSLHGYASYLTPCSELDVTHVTGAEAQAYRQFVDEYNSYWRNYFDPIAIRLQITPERYRIETLVLPLIDNTLYTALAQSLGGTPEPLDTLPVPRRNIFTFAVRVNKAAILANLGMADLIEPEEPLREQTLADEETGKAANMLKNLTLAIHNYTDAKKAFPEAGKNGLSWRVHLLPFLEQQALYGKFHLDEPWDSEHNRQLIAQMPELFAGEDKKLNGEGKTRFVVPTGKGMVFEQLPKPLTFRALSDGTSNTVMVLEVADTEAVTWTKPDDFDLKGADLQERLKLRSPGAFLVAMGDGSVRFLRSNIAPATLDAMLTRAGGEVVDPNASMVQLPQSSFPSYYNRRNQVLTRLGVGKLITKGLGNQIAFHAYDTQPMFDLSLPQFLGMAVSMNGGRMFFDDDFLPVVPLVSSLNGPVYFSVPVEDAAIVDEFLGRLDSYLAETARQHRSSGWFREELDFYRLDEDGLPPTRCFSLGFGPVKWRFFWSRIDDAVVVASKREILADLAAVQAAGDREKNDAREPAHALVRLRPQNWDRVLETYRLGWEENSRDACLNNLGPLSSLSRAMSAKPGGTQPVDQGELTEAAARVYDVHHFCPDDGNYVIAPDSRSVSCSLHGTAREPQQAAAPASASKLGQLLAQFSDLSIRLTFLEDGLHAVATIDRTSAGGNEPTAQ